MPPSPRRGCHLLPGIVHLSTEPSDPHPCLNTVTCPHYFSPSPDLSRTPFPALTPSRAPSPTKAPHLPPRHPSAQADASFFFPCQISTHFAPGDFQGFALVNPQRNSRLTGEFTVEPVPEGAQLSFGNFAHLGHESFYWQLPETYQGDKVGPSLAPGSVVTQT